MITTIAFPKSQFLEHVDKLNLITTLNVEISTTNTLISFDTPVFLC